MHKTRLMIIIVLFVLFIMLANVLPSKAAALTEWNVPGQVSSFPQYLKVDDSSNVWFTEFGSGELGKLTFGTFTEYSLPRGSQPIGIAYYDNKLYFAESGRGAIGRMPTGGGSVDEFFVGDPLQSQLWGIAFQNTTRIWFTSSAISTTYPTSETTAVGLLNLTSTSQVKYWILPDYPRSLRGIVYSVNTGAWFVDYNLNRIGNIPDPLGSVVREWQLPDGSQPFDIALDSSGNVWFTDSGRSRIAMLNPHTNEISEYITPTSNSQPYGITVDSSDHVWFAEHGTNEIGRYDPQTNTFTEFSRITSGTPWGITTDKGGNYPIWFSDAVMNRIGRLSVDDGLTTTFGTLSSASTTSTTTGASTYTLSTFTSTTHYATSSVASNPFASGSVTQQMTTSTQYSATETVTILQFTVSGTTTMDSTITVTTTVPAGYGAQRTFTSYITTTTTTYRTTGFATFSSYTGTTVTTLTSTETVTATTTTYEPTTAQTAPGNISSSIPVGILFGAVFLVLSPSIATRMKHRNTP